MSQSGNQTASEWLEVSVTTSDEAVEAVTEMLMELGAGGVVIDDPRLLARRAAEIGPDLVDEPDAEKAWQQYIDAAVQEQPKAEAWISVRAYLPGEANEYDLAALRSRVANLESVGLAPGPAEVTTRIVREEDWANAWKRFYTIQRIGRKIVIVPSWLEYQPQPSDIVITLDPGMAFGTGTHPTTQLCLGALENRVHRGHSVLDLGTGSGILAIAAAKLGAQVLALDIDARAVAVAGKNADDNGVSEAVTTASGTLASIPTDAKYDVVVANIVADTIIAILPDVPGHLHAHSRFVASGIVENRLADVKDVWQMAGLAIHEVQCSGEWACIVGGLA